MEKAILYQFHIHYIHANCSRQISYSELLFDCLEYPHRTRGSKGDGWVGGRQLILENMRELLATIHTYSYKYIHCMLSLLS